MVLSAESGLGRGRSRPSRRDPPGPPAAGPAGELGCPGDELRAVFRRATSPHHSHPLAGSRPQSSSKPLPHPHLCSLMAVVVSMGPRPRRPQQLQYMDTAIKVTALTSFSLSIRVSNIGPASISCLSLGGVQRSGLSCKDTAHRYFRSTSVMGLFSKKGNCCELVINLTGMCYNMYSC